MTTRQSDPVFAGSVEHYEDAELYDHEYRRRRADVTFYRRLAAARPPAGPILELGIGTGRVASALARDGHSVVGIDLSRPMLARARRRIQRLPRAARSRVHLLVGDFRRFALARRFNLVTCPFNGLQHLYSSADIASCLASVRSHLAPGGRFVFDVLHPDVQWLSRDPTRRWSKTRFKHPVTGQRLVYSTNHDYDPVRQLAHVRIYYDPVDPPGPRGGLEEAHLVHLTHRQFFPQELRALLHHAGFDILSHTGDFEGAPLTAASDSQTVVATPA